MDPLTRPSATLSPDRRPSVVGWAGSGDPRPTAERVDVSWLYREAEYDSVTRGRCPGQAHFPTWPFAADEWDWHGHDAGLAWAAGMAVRAAGGPLAAGRGSGFAARPVPVATVA